VGAGSGGLNREPPGGMTCAEAALAKMSARITAHRVDACFMQGYLVIPTPNRK